MIAHTNLRQKLIWSFVWNGLVSKIQSVKVEENIWFFPNIAFRVFSIHSVSSKSIIAKYVLYTFSLLRNDIIEQIEVVQFSFLKYFFL